MQNIKFLVKLNRAGGRTPEYVKRIDQTPLQTTPDRKRALVMGRFTAEDVVKSLTNPRCSPELLSVKIPA